MAKEKKTVAPKKNPSFEEGLLPTGFEPISNGKLDGWFVMEKGNSVRGFLRDSFTVKGQFGEKRVYKIEISGGDTKAVGENGELLLGEGNVVGIDEKGWLKGLSSIKRDTEIYVQCLGQEEFAKKGQSPAWKFLIGAVPL